MKRPSRKLHSSIPPIVNLFIAIFVGVLVTIFRSNILNGLQFLWSLIVSIKDGVKDVISWLSSNIDLLWVKCLVAVLIVIVFSWPLTHIINKSIIKWKVKRHFKYSFKIVKKQLIPAMKNSVIRNKKDENREMDNFIQSPIEYANETVKGNQVPKFNPDDTYQDVLYDDEKSGEKPNNKRIKYIVVITAENPNMFLDPTIGFFMSNCYAASLIRHVNDYFKTTKPKTNSIPQLQIRDLKELEDDILNKREKIINNLKEGKGLQDYEFIRVFMYDKHQEECCKDAVFPSLKASQDLFRTISFYIQKEEIQNNLKNKLEGEKNKWDDLKQTNEKLWHFFDSDCKTNDKAKKVQDERIKNIVPEFVFVFYDNKIWIHTYLGGQYCKNDFAIGSNEGILIKKLIKILAEYISSDKRIVSGSNLNLGRQENKYKTFIDWEWV